MRRRDSSRDDPRVVNYATWPFVWRMFASRLGVCRTASSYFVVTAVERYPCSCTNDSLKRFSDRDTRSKYSTNRSQ